MIERQRLRLEQSSGKREEKRGNKGGSGEWLHWCSGSGAIILLPFRLTLPGTYTTRPPTFSRAPKAVDTSPSRAAMAEGEAVV